jgi:hypothetical protein
LQRHCPVPEQFWFGPHEPHDPPQPSPPHSFPPHEGEHDWHAAPAHPYWQVMSLYVYEHLPEAQSPTGA